MLKSLISRSHHKMALPSLAVLGATAVFTVPAVPALAMRCARCVSQPASAVKATPASKPAKAAQHEMKVGQTREFEGGLTINFVKVNEDSRCPEDADCVWAGNAKVTLRVKDLASKVHNVQINTGLEPRKATIGKYDITLGRLAPYPRSTVTIDKKAYIATIKVARESAKPASHGATWQNLYSTEKWYQEETGTEQLFSGTLEAVKTDPDRVTTLMRTNYYRLGGRMLYTGTHKSALLDSLIGKKVEIRGKAIDMALEGQNVSEIWPASIRVTH